MYDYSLVFMYFVSYSFAGWLYEFVYNITLSHRLHWRGFLTMPLLPIYGFSSLGIIMYVEPNIHNPFFVFIASMLVATAVELVTSVVLGKLFHVRLWDYAEWPYNFQGRVSLLSSLGFGGLGLLLVYVLHPMVAAALALVGNTALAIIAAIIFGVLLLDYINSTFSLVRLSVEFNRFSESLDDILASLGDRINILQSSNKKMLARFTAWQRYNLKQLRRAFPGITALKRRRPSKVKAQRH